MKNSLILLFTLLLLQSLTAQTRVTFQNDRLFLEEQGVNWNNPKQFYPIGWYGASGSNVTNMDLKSGFQEGMSSISASGSNTVLHYWNGIIDRYAPNPPVGIEKHGVTNYITALEDYLDDVDSYNLKAIVHLPYWRWNATEYIFPNDSLVKVINSLESHPALLGWYQADEPELDATNTLNYNFLRTRYEDFKAADGDHPVFVVFVNGLFRCEYSNISTSASNCNGTPGYRGPIYDILMVDRYGIHEDDPIAPHFYFSQFRTSLGYESGAYLNDYPSTSTSSSAMLVAQGYGKKDILNVTHSIDWTTNSHYPGGAGIYRRNPQVSENLFSFAIGSYFLQHGTPARKVPLSGLLFWSHRYADLETRTNVNELIEFLSDTEVHYALSQPETSTNYTVSGAQWPFWSMLREYKDSYYLLLINDQYGSGDMNSSLVNHSESDLNISISGVGQIAFAHEMEPKSMGGDAYYRKWVPITQTSSGNYQVIEHGSFNDTRDFTPYEVKIFRFTKAITWANISGPGAINSGVSYSWTANADGDNTNQKFYWYKKELGTSTWDYIGSGKTRTYTHGSSDSFDLKVRVNNFGGATKEAFKFVDLGGPLPKVNPTPSDLPEFYNLEQNYPNPFNPYTVINYSVPEQSNVKIEVFDTQGRLVKVLVNESKAPGFYSVTLDASGISSGLYIYKLTSGSFTQTKKLTLIK